jgi:hypothetical protein
MVEITKKNYKKAANMFTEIIEKGDLYDPYMRKYTLLCLKNIMRKF